VYALLRFSGSTDRDPTIAEWFAARPGELGALAHHWFDYLRHCGADVRELFHDGCPVLCVRDAPFGYVNAFSAHVNVGFFHGASLPDPAHLLEGTGKYMRHVKLRPNQPHNARALESLVVAAYADIHARLGQSAA
jgi:hypothetical protein